MSTEIKLTKQRQAFVDHYVLHRNGAEAHRHAYPKSAKQPALYHAREAYKLLKHPDISSIIEVRTQKLARIAEDKFEVTSERILRELAYMAFSNAGDYYDWGTCRRPVTRRGEPVVDASGEQVYEDVQYVSVKPSEQLTREQLAAVAGAEQVISRTGDVTIKVSLAEKRGALKLLGEHKQLWKSAEQAGGVTTINNTLVILPIEADV